MLPAILYIPLLVASYFIFDLFHTETAKIPDKTLQTTEFLNPDLPDAQIKGGDGIGSKYENMAKSWGKIQKNMNLNIRRTTSPCSMNNNRKKLRQRKLPMPRHVSKKLSQSWKKPSPKRD